MKKLCVFCALLILGGCAFPPGAPFQPSTGALITQIRAPLSIEPDKTDISKAYGQAASHYVAYYFFSFLIGDNSVQKAMKDGALREAAYADYDYLNVLGIYQKVTLNVYGIEKPDL